MASFFNNENSYKTPIGHDSDSTLENFNPFSSTAYEDSTPMVLNLDVSLETSTPELDKYRSQDRVQEDLVDFNNFQPVASLSLSNLKEEKPLYLQIVGDAFDQANSVQIVIIGFEEHIGIYSLNTMDTKMTTEMKKLDTNDLEDAKSFSISKLQECFGAKAYGQQIRNCAVNPLSCISSPSKTLSYGFTVLGSSTIFLVYEEGKNLTATVDIDNQELVTHLTENNSPVTHLAFSFKWASEGQFLATLNDNRMCVTWDLTVGNTFNSFALQSAGIVVSWSRYEPYKLMVAERDGFIRFYNVIKNLPVQTINLCTAILTADWCFSNSLFVAVGTYTQCVIVDVSKPYTTTRVKIHPCFRGSLGSLKFSQVNSNIIALLGKSDKKIKVYRQQDKDYMWSSAPIRVQAIAYMVGMPYLVAMSDNALHIYES